MHPHCSAYEAVYGHFDFTKTPLAPPGTKVVIYEKSSKRASWDYHGQVGFYIGLPQEHYRCMRCYVPMTKQERIADTIQFFPKKIEFPTVILNDHLMHALDKIVSILQAKDFRTTNKHLHIDNNTLQALDFITKILQKMSPTQHDTSSLPPSQVQGTAQILIPKLPVMPAFHISKRTNPLDETPPTNHDPVALPRVPKAPTVNPTNTPRETLIKTLQAICQRHLHDRTSQRNKNIMLKKLLHIYDEATGKSLTL